MFKTILRQTALATVAVASVGVAAAEDDFGALAGLDAAPMSETALDEVKGKNFQMPDFRHLTTVGGQVGLANYNTQFAVNGVNQWLNGVSQFRADTGYMGPIHSGVTAASISAANLGARNAFDNAFGSVQRQSDLSWQLGNQFVMGAIQGQFPYGVNGRVMTVAPTSASHLMYQAGLTPIFAPNPFFR
ncbi:MAG: hypothetical protein AAGC56_09240 [Pseudomonadota bacterium]